MSDLPHLAGYVEQLGIPETKSDAIEQRNNWVETAAQFSRNEDYYRGLLDAVAAHIGMPAFTADDGSISSSPIRAAIPDLVAAQIAAIAKLEAERDALLGVLKVADDAIAEMFRYYDGGETRGSYDGKPERNQLRKAGYATRAAIAKATPTPAGN